MTKTITSTEQIQGANVRVPAKAAHDYICDMLKELTDMADASELKELSALLSVTAAAAQTHKRLL